MKRMSLLPRESLSTVVRGTEHTSAILLWVLAVPNVPKQPSFVTGLLEIPGALIPKKQHYGEGCSNPPSYSQSLTPAGEL